METFFVRPQKEGRSSGWENLTSRWKNEKNRPPGEEVGHLINTGKGEKKNGCFTLNY